MNFNTILSALACCWQTAPPNRRTPNGLAGFRTRFWSVLCGMALLLTGGARVLADQSPVGCTGSALGINLFTSSPDVHIGDTIKYSVTVFNGLPGSPRVACDATEITAILTTPDGVVHPLTLLRTTLLNGQNDYYQDIVSYVVRSQDILPDGTVRATASDTGVIHQNDTNSQGGGDQGVNTEVSLPCIKLFVVCQGSVGETGLITFTGSVTNCGNNTLVGVTVTNQNDNGFFKVVFPTNLLRGAVATFSGSFIPLTPCTADTVTLVAVGVDQFTSFPRTVSSSAAITCGTVLTPGIHVTKTCPVTPPRPGQLLTFAGSVSNTGNVTLTNIVVVNNQPVANTVVFTLARLAPGAVANFTASYPAPVNCSVADTLLASAASLCGVPVSDTASATCAIQTTAQVAVSAICPVAPVSPGGTLTYGGTVQNLGDITQNNVTVVSDRPVANTVVFTVATLAPGASAAFTGSYVVLADVCSVATTLAASGVNQCTGLTVANTFVSTCTVATAPAVSVTLACPATTATTGGLITYTGTVRNSGNVTLKNVSVVNGQSVPPTVFSVATLAPGASANFTAAFTAPADACSVSATVTATGSDNCTSVAVSNTASATCPLLTTPALEVTQVCPVVPGVPGGLVNYTGTVRNSGNITLTNVVLRNDLSGAAPIFTVATLAPGVTAAYTGSYLAPTNCSVTSTTTATGQSLCGVTVANAASATCTILTAPAIAVTQTCPTTPVAPGALLTYGGVVRNTGNITLTNVTVINSRPVANTVVFTVASLAPGASANFTGSYIVPADSCSVATTLVASGQNQCTGVAVANTFVSTCAIVTAPSIDVTLACPAASVVPGSPITYTGTVKNTGDVTLNNVSVVNAQSSPPTVFTVASLAPGVSANFTATFTTPLDACSVSTTVTAGGTDSCGLAAVTDSASATCPLLTTPALAVTESCPATPAAPGSLLTYGGTVKNTGNVTLTNVVVTDDRNGLASATTTLWVDDDLLAGAATFGDNGDGFNFVTNNPAPYSGTRAHKSNRADGMHQHGFTSATPLAVQPGDIMIAYIYLDPATLPSEVMLQWYTGNFEHRAYWGADAINEGNPGTASRRYMGPLPAAAQWVRLEVPASLVGLENTLVSGIAFTLHDGQATWDATGKSAASAAVPTRVFTVATLAPGETANFTGSFTVPTNGICSVTTTLNASAADRCTGANVTATATSTCPLLTSPAIEVTQSCPTTQVVAGALLTYTGTVRNTGDIVLTNVTVFNSRSGTTPVFTVASLAPGASANFTGSYLTKLDCCEDSSTVTASGQACDGTTVTDTYTKTCTVFTAPGIRITKTCESGILKPGDTLTYSGTVSNTGTITLVNVFIRHSFPTPTIVDGPLILAPGESASYTVSFVVPVDFCGEDTVTVLGQDLCTAATVTDRVTSTCPVTTKPAIQVTKNCPTVLSPRGALFTYTGTVRNTGNVTLVNVTVVDTQPSNNTPVLGPFTLAPGASTNFSASYIAPMCCCEVIDTLTARGQDRCTGVAVSDTATAVCQLLIAPSLAVTRVCPATTVPAGGLFTYTGTVRNSGDVVLKDVIVVGSQAGGTTQVFGPLELAPGESKSFSGSYTVTAGSSPANDTVTATGTVACRDGTVTATASCAGLVAPVITSIRVTNGVATVTWTSTPGGLYRLLSNTNSQDPNWSVVPGDVTATGASASKSDSSSAPAAQRFYRVSQP